MCLGGKIKREKVNFAKLYEGIKNDVVRERIKSSGEWYIENAMKYKIWFWVLSIFGIVAPLVITIISSIEINGKGSASIRIVIAVCSVLTSFSSTLLAVSKCKEKWTNYRNAVEQIKSALVWYSVDDGEDNEKFKRLVTRTERIMKEELNRWNEIAEMDEQKNERTKNN